MRQQYTTRPHHRPRHWLALGAAAALLAACGGGSGSGNPPDGDAPRAPFAGDRIEPYDPGPPLTFNAAAAKNAPRARAAAEHIATVRLPASWPQAKIATPAQDKSGALPIGAARAVPDTASSAATQALLHWHAAADGTQVAALRFVSPAAHGVRLGVHVQALPEGALLRAYGSDAGAAVEITQAALQQMAARNAADAHATAQDIHTWWSPDFAGEATTLEVQIPPAADPQAVQIAVPRLMHHLLSLQEAVDSYDFTPAKDVGDSASCHINAACSPESALESRAVARMVYVRGDASYLCSGTLLNDAQNSATPHLLTAAHCISTQREASSLTTDWFFRASSCGGTRAQEARQRLPGGATLLYSGADTDVTLLRLDATPPPGVAFAGSYFGAPPPVGNTAVSGLHHPSGDLQKVSASTLRGVRNCEFSGQDSFGCERAPARVENGRFWEVVWQQGSTEPGSSGSALFATQGNTRYVIGQLSGGSATCQNPQGSDYYGRFDLAWRAGLRDWLAPD